MDYTFHSPYMFGLLVLIPLYLGWYLRQQRKRKAVYVPVLSDLLQSQKRTWRRFVPILKPILVVCILALSSYVLARPQVPHDAVKINKTGVDIFLALDVSESMLAEDLKPNRIEAAKTYIDKFVSRLESDRAGLIIFAGKPFTQSPLTFDYAVLSHYLEKVSTRSINQHIRGLNGTAIGDAILLTLSRFKKQEERTKVLVLLTDGDANIGVDPVVASEMARGAGIKIYTIGIGQKEGALIPLGLRNGQKIYAKDQQGNYVKTNFNPETLKKIAENTGGKFFHAETNNSLEYSFDEIQALEKTELESEKATQYTEKFPIYLFVLFGVLCLYFFVENVVDVRS